MKKTTLNYIVDVPLLAQSVIVSLTGVVLMFGSHNSSFLGLSSRTIFQLHEQIGLLMIAFSLIHVLFHWKWFVCTTKNLFGIKSRAGSTCNVEPLEA